MKQFQFQKIREFREAAGLTQLELAGKVGVMVQQISAWERSEPEKSMTVGNLIKIAGALNKNPNAFFVEQVAGDDSKPAGA